MVTTRSADKRVATDGKVEDLALRSRVVEADSASPTPSRSSIKKRVHITVDIPIPSEDADDAASFTTARDTLSSPRKIDPQSTDHSKDLNLSGVSAKVEIPDSQETPKKDELANGQDFVSLGEEDATDSTPISTRTRTRGTKRKINLSSQDSRSISTDIANDTVTPTTNGSHRRFGSEDPADESDTIVVATQSDTNERDDILNGSDDEAAPEVTSTKHTTSTTPSKRANKRRKATQTNLESTTLVPSIVASTPTISAHSTDTDVTIQPQDEPPITTDECPLEEVPEARQTIIHTPSTHQTEPIPSSTTSYTTTTDSDITIAPYQPQPQPQPSTLQSLTSNLTNLHLRHSKPSSPAFPTNTNTPNLPPKATNGINQYRFNKTLSRKGKFHLQTDWPGKRRKFVLA